MKTPMLDRPLETKSLTAAELRAQRRRSIAIALSLGALVVLFFVLTLAKLGPQILSRPL